jgi:hypothetical protein
MVKSEEVADGDSDLLWVFIGMDIRTGDNDPPFQRGVLERLRPPTTPVTIRRQAFPQTGIPKEQRPHVYGSRTQRPGSAEILLPSWGSDKLGGLVCQWQTTFMFRRGTDRLGGSDNQCSRKRPARGPIPQATSPPDGVPKPQVRHRLMQTGADPLTMVGC